jgi:DUF1680 family protein
MQELNAAHLIPHCELWVEKAGWIANFEAAVTGSLPTARTGPVFSDSEVYKLLEAMAWEIERSGDPGLERRLQAIVDRILPAVEDDGYLNTSFGRPGQPGRYSDLQWGHELYCYGHLIQAGIARARTRGEDDPLFQLAIRVADHVCVTFGVDGSQGVCGHPEIEVALVELARQTGARRYLDQARLFIERRGRGVLGNIPFGRSYFQDDVPVRNTEVMSGHAVRALYLAAGAVDLAIEDADSGLLRALTAQVARTAARRTYLTGGMGARHEGEAFGEDFALPSDRAYSETCAGVGSVMVNYRLLLATGAAGHADAIERTLYNVVATSPAQDGKAFFYTNTLHKRSPGTVPAADVASSRAASGMRAPWFEVSCCPPNVARTLGSLSAYFATVDDHGIQIHQYGDSEITTTLADGRAVGLRIRTRYPDDGRISVEVLTPSADEWTLSLRVPSWAVGATLTVEGETSVVEPGTVTITRAFAPREIIELTLPTEPRWTRPDPRIDAVRASVAVERGPLVLCVESVDLPSERSLDELRALTSEPIHDDDGQVTIPVAWRGDFPDGWPFGSRPMSVPIDGPDRVRLIPYHDWANRGPSAMRVWLPDAEVSADG